MNKKIVFVDFFDTIMFRYVHPFQVTERWAENILHKYGIPMMSEHMVALRSRCFRQSLEENGEVIYSDGIGRVYDHLTDEGAQPQLLCTKEEFVKFSKDTEIALETGVQYPNRTLIRYLQRKKAEGKRIYIVSDFYMGATELEIFLTNQEINSSLFDGIFVSSDFGTQKQTGGLYDSVLAELNIDPNTVVMIGDNLISDSKMAKKHGISVVLKRRLLHKVMLKVRQKLHYDFSGHIGKTVVRRAFNSGLPFAEYITIFFSFTERLKKAMSPGAKAVFLSREGFYLKHLLEQYDYYATKIEDKSDTGYFLCSRRAIASTQPEKIDNLWSTGSVDLQYYLISAGFTQEEIPALIRRFGISEETLTTSIDEKTQAQLNCVISKRIEQNRESLFVYAKQVLGSYSSQPNLHFIDIGWYGSMQLGLEKILGIKTDSFYLGITEKNSNISRTGLIFSEEDNILRPTFFHVLKANMQLYEQLSAAPHGSAQTYIQHEYGVDVPLVWEENEKRLYYSEIEPWQKKAEALFCALAAWRAGKGETFSNRDNCCTVLRSALFADKTRLEFLKRLDKGFLGNFGQNTKGLKYNPRLVKVDASLILSPEKYTRYIAKVQRLLPANVYAQILYRICAWLFSVYTRVVLFLKRAQ